MEILYRDLATRTPVKILNSDLSLRSLTGNFCGDLLYRTCTDSRLPYKGILPSSFYREPVREILQTIFYRDFRKRNLQNLNSHLFLMFLATLFGVSCQNIFFKLFSLSRSIKIIFIHFGAVAVARSQLKRMRKRRMSSSAVGISVGDHPLQKNCVITTQQLPVTVSASCG